MSKILLIVCLVLTFVACNHRTGSNSGGLSSDNRRVSAAVSPTPAISPNDDPREAIFKSKVAELAAKSYRSTTIERYSNGEERYILFEYVAPDRYHMKTNFSDVITIGTDTYDYHKGNWRKLPVDLWFLANSHNPDILDEIKRAKM